MKDAGQPGSGPVGLVLQYGGIMVDRQGLRDAIEDIYEGDETIKHKVYCRECYCYIGHLQLHEFRATHGLCNAHRTSFIS